MNIMTICSRLSSTVLTVLLTLMSSHGHARVIVDENCTLLPSTSGATITECAYGYNGSGINFGATYTVHNQSLQPITAFAVSTTAQAGSEPWSELPTWRTAYVSESTWNATAALSTIGQFATVFGANEHAAFLYWNGTLTETGLPGTITGDAALAAGQDHGGYFGFSGGYPASEFIAFSGTSNSSLGGLTPVAASFMNVGAVPEPASMALMLAGLGVVGTVARRRRV